VFAFLTGAGLSASAGLNAYIPLLIVGLVSRFTDALRLPSGWDWLSSWWALTVMAVLLLVEVVVDKVPVVDHVNDIIQTAVRPAAGGAVLSASTAAGQLDAHTGTALHTSDNPVLGWVVGIVIALCVHVTKALMRPVINGGTLGFGTPVVSAVEDTGSAGMSLLAIFVPILAGVALLLMVVGFVWLWRARRRWKQRRARAKAAKIARRYALKCWS
jgi:uncharacterized membrane protein